MSLTISLSSPKSDDKEFIIDSLGWDNCTHLIEPVGKQFELVWAKIQKGDIEVIGLVDSDSENKEDKSSGEESEDLEQFKKKYHSRQLAKQAEQDHYEIMGLGHLRWRANDNDIKQAYKKMILVCHPDKNQDLGGNDEAFKALVKSYNILSDLKKRRAYDSSEPFDDDLPSAEDVESGNFYKVFEPVFEMNSRWSSIQPAPKLGDDKTPYDRVVKFYNFWWSFKSWRDFSFEDDHDYDQAECREEKRWMERENEKKRAKLRKAEATRIQDLANMAYKKDPRIQKKVQEEENKKKNAKEAKAEAKRKAQEEKEAAERAERERVEAEERKKKEEADEKKRIKQEQQAIVKKNKVNFRNACNSLQPIPRIEDVELIIASLENIQLVDITNEMDSKPDGEQKKQVFQNNLNIIQEKVREQERQFQESRKQNQQQKEVKEERVWTEEELHQLAKAIQKFPPGIQNRWETIAQCIPTRSLKDVIAKAKSAQPTQAKAFTKPVVQVVGSEYDKLKSKVGEKEIKSALSSKVDLGQVPPSELDKPTATTTTTAATTTTTAATTTNSTTTETPAQPAEQKSAKPAAKKEKAVEWTPEEQKLLEEGLQKIDKSAEDRWDQIAAKVGKSKKDCVARYKYLVTLVKTQASK
ncbi:hypothetical protein DICPUDRAFT_29919 [Dictyostelium purpureum]|uniref:DnaJ homolog subfamily C member 2 n=1 Tax=Dictyostelium purpureum TaxID=5786 RepID=F0ZEG7_DICPU|nr:uncharacterized protein DICPUDRAFT_29919 [Dictyostelium purpureum]EGC37691.1 hypothetical protein DICPUDRAFT_29919 [Dictyostelium purpureum]|eukprot:XP_003285795.1 hypothetical protein DICPUDRAFT_29919 [Dictyostelium purpureum]